MKAIGEENEKDLLCIMEHLLQEQVPLVVSRVVWLHMAKEITACTGSWCESVVQGGVDRLKPRVVSFEEVDAILREYLAACLMEVGDWISAAQALSGINIESGSRQYEDPVKAEKYVKIAELYLQEDDTVQAENFINRAARVIHTVTEWALQLRYKVSYARILDAKRKFLDASVRYYELSKSNPEEVDAEDLAELLKKSVTCALLASAGPQRSRVLGTLYKVRLFCLNICFFTRYNSFFWC